MNHRSELANIAASIRKLGGAVYVLHQGPGTGRKGALWGTAGIPDMLAFLRGRMFWVEVKVGRDKLRPAQAGFIEHAREAGVPVVVGTCSDVLDWIEKGAEPCT